MWNMKIPKLFVFLIEASDELTNQTSLILGGLIIFLILFIIFLVLKIRKLHSGTSMFLFDLQNFLFALKV